MDPFDLREWPHFEHVCAAPMLPHTLIDQVCIDSRQIHSSHALFIALNGMQDDGHCYLHHAEEAGAQFALVRKTAPIKPFKRLIPLLVEDPLLALQEIARCYRKKKKAKVIAITGSYGKTMLKDLLSHLLSPFINTYASPESFNSQLGVPLSLLMMNSQHEVALIEAGISQPGEMSLLSSIISPDHAILTNIGKAHLNTMGSIELTMQEKMHLVQAPSPGNWRLVPQDSVIAVPESSDFLFWNREYPHLPQVNAGARKDESTLCYQVDFPDGQTYVGNLVNGFAYHIDLLNIALKASWLLGVPDTVIKDYLGQYLPEPMKWEVWRSSVGATLVNDTYCANPMSVEPALKKLSRLSDSSHQGKKIFLFGGIKQQEAVSIQSLKRIGQAIADHHVDLLALIENQPFEPLVAEVARLSPQTVINSYSSISTALNALSRATTMHDTILIKNGSKIPVEKTMHAFDGSIPHNQVIINLAAIQSNLESIRKKVGPDQRIMVMVKALAYGTNDAQMARCLELCGVDILGVSYVEEGVSLKKNHCSQSIFVLNVTPYEVEKAVHWGFEIGISDSKMIHLLQEEAARCQKKIAVHLHIDTGMGRFGCRPEQSLELAQQIAHSSHLIFEGIFTHFAASDHPSHDSFTVKQADQLQKCVRLIQAAGHKPPWIHACNSAAALRFHFPQFNMIRLGLAVYGLHTSSATQGLVELYPALSLLSRIVGINECQKGDTISYGRNYTVLREQQRIAVLPMGYFDGMHRHFSGKGQVMIRGMKAPMVGNVCMDYMMVDISDIPQAEVGDTVLFFGEDLNGQYISIEDFAEKGGSIAHELMTCLGPRIQRLFIYDESLKSR